MGNATPTHPVGKGFCGRQAQFRNPVGGGKSAVDNHSQGLQMVLMIICVCNRINCRSVREAVESGARSPNAVQSHHGCKFNCGKCSTMIGDMIAEHMDRCVPQMQILAAE